MSATDVILQNIFRRMGRSLLQYVRDAFPWTSLEEQDRLQVLRRLIDEEQQACARLSAFMRRRRITLPYLGPYPQSFTTINYVSLDHLLQHLIAHEKAEIVELERYVPKLHDDMQAREQVEEILELARRRLATLEELAARKPAAAA